MGAFDLGHYQLNLLALFLNKDRIIFWVSSFKNGDIDDVHYQQVLIDTLVNSVYVYDNDKGGRKIVVMFNLSKQNTAVIKGSDIERSTPLYGAYPNHLIYTKECFGIVLEIEGEP